MHLIEQIKSFKHHENSNSTEIQSQTFQNHHSVTGVTVWMGKGNLTGHQVSQIWGGRGETRTW